MYVRLDYQLTMCWDQRDSDIHIDMSELVFFIVTFCVNLILSYAIITVHGFLTNRDQDQRQNDFMKSFQIISQFTSLFLQFFIFDRFFTQRFMPALNHFIEIMAILCTPWFPSYLWAHLNLTSQEPTVINKLACGKHCRHFILLGGGESYYSSHSVLLLLTLLERFEFRGK